LSLVEGHSFPNSEEGVDHRTRIVLVEGKDVGLVRVQRFGKLFHCGSDCPAAQEEFPDLFTIANTSSSSSAGDKLLLILRFGRRELPRQRVAKIIALPGRSEHHQCTGCRQYGGRENLSPSAGIVLSHGSAVGPVICSVRLAAVAAAVPLPPGGLMTASATALLAQPHWGDRCRR